MLFHILPIFETLSFADRNAFFPSLLSFLPVGAMAVTIRSNTLSNSIPLHEKGSRLQPPFQCSESVEGLILLRPTAGEQVETQKLVRSIAHIWFGTVEVTISASVPKASMVSLLFFVSPPLPVTEDHGLPKSAANGLGSLVFFSSDPARFAFRRIIQSGVVVVHLGVVPKTNIAFRSVC